MSSPPAMNLTPAQQRAVDAHGNVLVSASAGTGKTGTLVARCLRCLCDSSPNGPRASLDEILVVTFTEAAAAEMRERLRARLEEQQRKAPDDPHWDEQLVLFDAANIGTLHSFCFRLARRHFHQLQLDPQFSVLDQGEARWLAGESVEAVLQRHYAARDERGEAVRELVLAWGGRGDRTLRALLLQLHEHLQTRPDPAAWLEARFKQFAAPTPELWRQWLHEGVANWRKEWEAVLQNLQAVNEKAAECLAILRAVPPESGPDQLGQCFARLQQAAQVWPKGKKAILEKPLKAFFEGVEFLAALVTRAPGGADPLTEDWTWTRRHMTTLLQLARDFEEDYSREKREAGVADFHDLEQFALQLLWDFERDRPTALAEQWQRKIRFVFVDEYQDINAAQDRIITALSRMDVSGVGFEVSGGPSANVSRLTPDTSHLTPLPGNRFLVGDVKQSIYRFRQADPSIFAAYEKLWQGENGQTLSLAENFRSREGLLNFINDYFTLLMRPELGGMNYDAAAQLQFGAPEQRHALSAAADPRPRVEWLLRRKGGSEGPPEGAENVAELQEAEKDARLLAMRLKALRAKRHEIQDEGKLRPVDWRDMAVLLRAPAGKAESYAKAFAQTGVPLSVQRRGFYDSSEVADLLSLLQLLDNPLQDIPAIAILRSPLVGLSLDELAAIRLTSPVVEFWRALNKFRSAAGQTSDEPQEAEDYTGAPPLEPQPAQPGKGPLTPSLSPSEGERVPKAGEGPVHGVNARITSEHSHPIPLPLGGGEGARRAGEGAVSISEAHRGHLEAATKVNVFLERFTRWRRLARQTSLSRCLETVLAETKYEDWLRGQNGGAQRRANVRQFVGLARRFDEFQRQGLFRFLGFIEAQREAEAEPEVAATGDENAVRLMSIHQSKGLEFPVVAVADLAKPFNFADLRADIILDEEFGPGPRIMPPPSVRRYPSLPHWLAGRRQKREILGEELRLLYVAMTRARDTLILAARVSAKNLDGLWTEEAKFPVAAAGSARSSADWLGLWFAKNCAGSGGPEGGEHALVRWTIHADADLAMSATEVPTVEPTASGPDVEASVLKLLRERLNWEYPFAAATHKPAKASVSTLRRQANEDVEEEAREFFRSGTATAQSTGPAPVDSAQTPPVRSAGQVGTVHHRFLQFVSLERADEIEFLKQEGERLVREGMLSAEEAGWLDLEGIAAFWRSDFGRKIRAQAACVRRELEFTARFAPDELALVSGAKPEPALADEFVVVQGVADLAVILPGELWLVDFKTDALQPDELAARTALYEPQLKLYSLALERIYGRRVTESRLCFLSLRTCVPIRR